MDNASEPEMNPVEPAAAGSGAGRRLIILLLLFVVAAGGIWGYQQYLQSQIPKGDEEFAKELDKSIKPEEEETSLDMLKDMFGSRGPTQEVEELKKYSADEVAFTFDAIMAMSDADLKKNIAELTDKLVEVRKNLPPSFGAGSMGGSPDGEGEDAAKPKLTDVQQLALPLEVMQQVAASR